MAAALVPIPTGGVVVGAAVAPVAEAPADVAAAETEPEIGPDISDTRLSECARLRP